MTWWSSWDCVQFYGKHKPKQVKVTTDGKEFTLTGKTLQREKESRKSSNDHTSELGFDTKIISPKQGAADLRELEVLARQATKDGNTDASMLYVFRLAQLNEPDEGGPTPTGSTEQRREQTYLLSRPKPRGQFTAEIYGVSQELQREWRRTLLHIDASRSIPRVTLINADDEALMDEENQRESLYPFGDEKITEVNAVKRQPPATTINSEGHQQLVQDILAGTVNTGYQLKPEQIREYGLDEVIQAAIVKKKRSQQLHETPRRLPQINLTLGKSFWTTDLREQLTDTLQEEYDDVIREELKVTTLNPHLEPAYIRLNEDWNGCPTLERFRRMSPKETEVCRRKLQELLEKGMIDPSSSPFGAAVMIIPKPHQANTFRMVIDYIQLNAITTSYRYPLPDIQEMLAIIDNRGYQLWSSFDVCSGFYNVPIYEPYREYNAMVTPFGSYQWKVMATGLKNSPSMFQRNMQHIFHDMPQFRIFVDDGIVGGRTLEEAYENMKMMLDRLREKNMVVKTSKMQLFRITLNFLGHVIS
jgi:hypothetical protein